MNKTLVALGGIAAFLVVAYLGYSLLVPQVNQCEAIFQQTAPSLEANVKFLKSEGALVLGQKQLQELDSQAQQIGLNLKSCCVMAGAGNFDQFNQCKASAVLYDKQVAEAVEAVKAVSDAGSEDLAQKQAEAEARLAQIIQSANAASTALEQKVAEISGKQPDTPTSAPQGPGTLRPRAVLTQGGDNVESCFNVHDPKADAKGNLTQLDRKCGISPRFELPAGQYVVDTVAGESTVRSTMTVAAGQVTETTVDLNSGYLRTEALLVEGGERADACFAVFGVKEDAAGKHKELARTCANNPTILLPAGDYLLGATSGPASARAEVKILAGKRTDQPMILNAGYLRSHAELTSGGEPVSACFEVFSPKEDALGNYKLIDRSCNAEARLILPAGDYKLSAQSGSARNSVDVTVTPGQATKQAVVLNAGYLRVEAQLSGQSVSACFDIYEPKQDVKGNRVHVTRACEDKAVFTLPAGSYFLEAKAGDAKGQQTVDVVPGDNPNDYVVSLSKS